MTHDLRDRVRVRGPETLADAELLSIVTDISVDKAMLLLTSYGNDYAALRREYVDVLADQHGLTRVRAARVVAAMELATRVAQPRDTTCQDFRDAAAVYRYIGPRLVALEQEQFYALCLDGRYRLQGDHLIAQGATNMCPVVPRDALTPAVRSRATAVVYVHNHPSGDPSPSSEDLDLTRRLADACRLLGIRMLDHVIVAETGYRSMQDMLVR